MRHIRLMVVALVVLAWPAGTAWAQPAPWQPERVTAGWVFTPGIVVGTLRDTNVTLVNEGDPRVTEWVTLVNPRGELDFNGRRTRFNLGYSGAFERYAQFGELNRYEQRGRFESSHQITPRLTLTSSAMYTSVPTTDRLELAGGALPFLDVGSTLFSAEGRFQMRAAARTRIEGGYRFERVQYDEIEATSEFLRDGHTHLPSLGISRDMTSRLSLGARWEFGQGVVANLQSFALGEQTFQMHNLTGEVSFRVSESTTVTGGAGGSRLFVSDTDLATWGPALHGGIDHKVGRASVGARYSRAFVPSYSYGGITASETVSGNAVVPFAAGRYFVSGSVAYDRTDPVEELGIGFEYSSIWVNTAVGIQIARWLRSEVFLSTSHQSSSARGDADRTRVGVQFVTFKPMRIH